MIKNAEILEKLEKSIVKKSRLSYSRKLKIYEGLYKEACSLGIFPLKNPLEGIEEKILFVRRINSV